MPAEWEKHEGTWLTWPKDPITWPDRVPQVEEIYLEMIYWISQGEKVFLLVDDIATQEKVLNRLQIKRTNLKNVICHVIPTVDSWIRDYGPNFLVREIGNKKELAFNHWIFNAWGGKYAELMEDTKIPEKISSFLKIPVFKPGLVLEGGSIDVNGAGTCLTTKQCLLNPKRNPQLNQNQIEDSLKEYLGVNKVIWLEEGIVGDDTDGHIDDIARFVNPTTVVCAVSEDSLDENYEILETNFEILRKATDQDGKPLTVVTLPMPGKLEGKEGRLPASYANFYIANNVVLVPTFQKKSASVPVNNDARALNILKELFPDRKVVGIDCKDLVWGLGAIHCVTQQQPALIG
ncbi:MAG: agmatine deiminase [Deltaproteobacteria bacterium RIFCSPLOWO2_01_44_7]|nr:MAG: agmatine deiminase [Deltaproteobacteria bacterium RIFCSPHIGHO2_01_FULL_43_49]OGQ15577.1 MAG: agmatine deiminase [Deltaproteobacteria bacterium RIFCSPHIGHO2_02_FULL_44_53]OGQ28510.1 MAG: agmatine deiminase [Deltaproteobacteria bacterium RIFCSPHIGHO2_12_FULL_44_21]OGQ32384.1 MAG: agmatine deiminase [Deltaproteobacteria bacterium RIFCSPLOWO2_01_FULL_45_74]OGQ40333.1 MAG: agmatine deiminase [Deltaproteobacteria bacterium RIFCSPLOWO2_01_44_7]OGQ44026.1 MAG: agmatine deiminase [Deltaproteoba